MTYTHYRAATGEIIGQSEERSNCSGVSSHPGSWDGRFYYFDTSAGFPVPKGRCPAFALGGVLSNVPPGSSATIKRLSGPIEPSWRPAFNPVPVDRDLEFSPGPGSYEVQLFNPRYLPTKYVLRVD